MISEKVASCILTIGEDYASPRGGISSVILTYSKYFKNFKFSATYLPKFNKYFNLFYFPFAIVKLITKLVYDPTIKIVHIHGAHYGSFFRKYLVFLIAKSLLGKKIIYHSHGSDFHLFYQNSSYLVKKLVNHFLTNADLIICLSSKWKFFFEENFNIKSIIILENIIDEPPLRINSKEFSCIKVLFLGLVGERKGIFDLLEVIKNHKAYFSGKLQLIIGGNGEITRLQHYITEHGLQDLISYQGWVSGNKKQELFTESSLFILPSYNEGLPIAILEAMSYKLPVISTNVGGIGEILHNGVNGYLIEPGNKDALFQSLKSFITQPGLIGEMGEHSAKIVSPYYSNAVIPKLEDIYVKLLSSK